jgi:hypothetical protein
MWAQLVQMARLLPEERALEVEALAYLATVEEASALHPALV